MARRKISAGIGIAALDTVLKLVDGEETPDRNTMATAVRYLLEELAERFPGNTLEVRVPPYGAVQCVEGPKHTRGTPPNVVELTPDAWILLAVGCIDWENLPTKHKVSASGTRATLAGMVPLITRS